MGTMRLSPVSGTGQAPHKAPKEIAPRRTGMRRASDSGPGPLKVLVFGPWGSGKTYSIVGLLELGYTVYVLSTDLGGNGLMTVQTALIDRPGLLDRLYYIEPRGFREVLDFIENPLRTDPEFFSRAQDVVLFWDGFSYFQSSDVLQYVGENAPGASPGELRSEGFQLELLDWNAVRNATLRALGAFLSLGPSGPDARPWHKVVTCQESIRAKRRPGSSPAEPAVVVDERRPLLSGQGGILAGAAFDLIIETRARRAAGSDDGARAEYVYITEGDDIVYAKRRGFNLPAVMPADMKVLWSLACKQAGLSLPEAGTI